MFRHGDDLYLVARRDVDGPFDLGYTELPFDVQKVSSPPMQNGNRDVS